MGATPLDEAGVKAVAAMPSREELIASIVACIGAPAAQPGRGDWRARGEHRGHPHHPRGARGGLTSNRMAGGAKTLPRRINNPI